MSTEELELVLQKGEDQQVEFKQCREKVPRKFYTTEVSFLNDREYDRELSITDYTRISERYFRKRNTFSESEILPHLRFEDFDEHLFRKFAEFDEIESFLFQKGSSWIEKGVKLKNCRINKINDIDFLEFQKGSSISEKGRKYFPKRMLQILKLLIICITPVKTEDILHLLTFGSRDKLRELYLKPLREDGVLEPLIKDKPNSPEQKFVLTDKGRLFLGGFDIE